MSYISFEQVKKTYKMGEVSINAADGVDFAFPSTSVYIETSGS